MQATGMFTFENSFGEEEHGTEEEIAQRFVAFDRSLTMKGYIRMPLWQRWGRCVQSLAL
jgi:hypothetical protein